MCIRGDWCGLVCRLMQVRPEQLAGVMEGDLAGEGGQAASTIMAAADSVRMWHPGKGGAYYAPGAIASDVWKHYGMRLLCI